MYWSTTGSSALLPLIHFSELPKSHFRLGLALTSVCAFRFVLGLRPKPQMPPKKKQKLIKGQSFISFGRPNEQTEDKVDKSDPGPSTQTATESDRQTLSEKEGQKVKEKRPRVFQQNWKVLHPWLIYEDGAMFCSLCREAGCKNPFSQKPLPCGRTRSQRSPLCSCTAKKCTLGKGQKTAEYRLQVKFA